MDYSLQAPLSLGFSRQESWDGLLCPPPRDLPDPGIEPRSPALQADSLLSEPSLSSKATCLGWVRTSQDLGCPLGTSSPLFPPSLTLPLRPVCLSHGSPAHSFSVCSTFYFSDYWLVLLLLSVTPTRPQACVWE